MDSAADLNSHLFTKIHQRMLNEGLITDKEFNHYVMPWLWRTRKEVVTCIPANCTLLMDKVSSLKYEPDVVTTFC